MDNLIELQRHRQEERDRLMNAITMEMVFKKTTHHDQINSDHRSKNLLNRFMKCSSDLYVGYQDDDGKLNEEISDLGGGNALENFYDKLKEIKNYHGDSRDEIAIPLSLEFEQMAINRENPSDETKDLVDFNDEEGFGHFLDLHECYDKYVNLSGVVQIDYITYLEKFNQLHDIPKDRKNADYRKYVQMLLDYLQNYCARSKPLLDLEEGEEKLKENFEKQWQEGTFPGWGKDAGSAISFGGSSLDLTPFSTWEELSNLGLDRIKFALMALGVKCGGTLEDRAKRLFSTKGKEQIEFDPSILAAKRGKHFTARGLERQKEIAFLEARVYKFSEILWEEKEATKDNVQCKQAQTVRERDEPDCETDGDDDSDEDDEVPLNPKNVPLDWNGKPMPYWLYKLHGLNLTFNCEICGNVSYRGPKAFQNHFSQPCHARGMSCLGIPNTAHFSNITKICDALSLWQKLSKFNELQRWKPERDEEFEDRSGNIMNKRTHTDLKRQGIL